MFILIVKTQWLVVEQPPPWPNNIRPSLIYEAPQTLTPRTVSQLANSLLLNLSYAFFGYTKTFTYGLQGLGGPAINAKSGLEDSFFSA